MCDYLSLADRTESENALNCAVDFAFKNIGQIVTQPAFDELKRELVVRILLYASDLSKVWQNAR